MIALTIIFALIVTVTWGTMQMVQSYQIDNPIQISLDPIYLPLYAIRTTLRLIIALFFSLVFTFIFGTLAAKNKHAESIIIPIIDILQSVPVLSFLSITVTGFISLFKNNMLGPECAAIFGIFTSQVWNITLSFYLGVKTVPQELKEVSRMFHLSSWECFWKIEVPFSAPKLLWNIIISMSNSWFFVIACEAFSVAGYNITLPGIGSYISLAITQANNKAIIYAIICMLLVIFLYNQLLFQPMLYWVNKFKKYNEDEKEQKKPILINLLQKTKWLRQSLNWINNLGYFWMKLNFISSVNNNDNSKYKSFKTGVLIYYLALLVILILSLYIICKFIFFNVIISEIKYVIVLGIYTTLRVMIAVFLSSIIWVPIGVFIGLKPRLSSYIQSIIQFVIAFPVNLFFPIITVFIIKYKLNIELWAAPLMVLGTQWYILFNVIVGAGSISRELKLAAINFKVKGILWWKRVVFPAIAPDFITGAIASAGGAWNVSIIAETLTWGNYKINATGLGHYIQLNFVKGNFVKTTLGTMIMCIIVFLINRIFWKPLYNMVTKNYLE